MPIIESLERTIISRAQRFVEEWRRDPGRRPFGQALAQAERKLWGTLPDAEQQREAFRKVAKPSGKPARREPLRRKRT